MPFKPIPIKPFICVNKKAVRQLEKLLEVEDIKDVPQFERFLKKQPFNRRGEKMTAEERDIYYTCISDIIADAVKNVKASNDVNQIQQLHEHIRKVVDEITYKRVMDIKIRDSFNIEMNKSFGYMMNFLYFKYGRDLEEFAREHWNVELRKD